jgi:hypothetical protein
MRVLFYVGDKQWSGSSRATLTAAQGLASRGHTVAVASSADGRLDRLVRDAGIEAISISALTSAGGAWDLRRVLRAGHRRTVVNTTRDHLIAGSAIRFADLAVASYLSAVREGGRRTQRQVGSENGRRRVGGLDAT